ncbi:MAG: PqqD family protein [Deltaproteobacteria bacterium]|nr:PqqD family protein [Deltaproteobacteria bacterium]
MSERSRRGRGEVRASATVLPRALQTGVWSTDLGDELVVYDARQHQGHCLNRPAAAVWRNLDGEISMSEMVARLQEELDAPADEETVWLALEQLDEAKLLEGALERPASGDISRREMLGRLGAGAALLPVILTVVAPPAHAQASAVTCQPQDSCATFTCAGDAPACRRRKGRPSASCRPASRRARPPPIALPEPFASRWAAAVQRPFASRSPLWARTVAP